jgi:hypothetical protein
MRWWKAFVAAIAVLSVAGLTSITPAVAANHQPDQLGYATWTALTPAQLEKAGWTCVIPIPTTGLHCLPSNEYSQLVAGELPVGTVRFFDTQDPNATGPFGTETIIRSDLFNGQPCPGNPDDNDQYLYLGPIAGFNYYACDHGHVPF